MWPRASSESENHCALGSMRGCIGLEHASRRAQLLRGHCPCASEKYLGPVILCPKPMTGPNGWLTPRVRVVERQSGGAQKSAEAAKLQNHRAQKLGNRCGDGTPRSAKRQAPKWPSTGERGASELAEQYYTGRQSALQSAQVVDTLTAGETKRQSKRAQSIGASQRIGGEHRV